MAYTYVKHTVRRIACALSRKHREGTIGVPDGVNTTELLNGLKTEYPKLEFTVDETQPIDIINWRFINASH